MKSKKHNLWIFHMYYFCPTVTQLKTTTLCKNLAGPDIKIFAVLQNV